MTDAKPKIEGKRPSRRPARNAAPARREYVSKVVGLESHTFDIGNAKYAAKYQKSVDAIANHIQKEYKGGPEIAKAIRDMSLPTIAIPPYPTTAAAGSGEVFLWQQDVTEAKKKKALLEENTKRAYALVLGQCSTELDSKIKGADAYTQAEADQDVVQLLLIIRGYCCRFEENQQSTYALESAKHRVSTYYQGYDVSTTEYVEHFKALVGVVETYGGAYGNEPGLVKARLIEQGVAEADLDAPDPDELKKAKAVCREEYLSCMVLRGADNSRFYQLKTDLTNDMTKGQDNFPKNLVETTHLLNDYKVPARQQRVRDPNDDGVAFVQAGQKKHGGAAAPSAAPDVDCWHCGKKGHYRSDCPELQVQELDVGIQNFHVGDCEDEHALFSTEGDDGLGLVQKSEERGVRGILSKHHLYIDTCASYASTPYRDLLENVESQKRGLVGHSNAGSCGMNKAGNLGSIKQMWLNEGGVASVVPLKVLEKIWPVTYDSRRHGGKFVLKTDQGDIIMKNNDKGMPYLDLRELEAEVALSFIQTVRGNMEGFTKREVEAAQKARDVQAMIGHPTDREFLGMVRSGMISNCPVTPAAVINSNRIHGPDPAGIRGRTVRTTPEPVVVEYVAIPRIILERHQRVALAADVMFVNGVPFLVSVSRGINLITTEYIPNRTAKQLAAGIRRVMDLYARGGFHVGTVLMDNEFEPLQNLVPILAVNTTAAKEHVPEVERQIRLIKERGRGILNTLPYKKMSQTVLVELIYHVVLWLNAFPSKSGVSDTYSPREIVYRQKLDFKKHCRARFGAYCEAHDEPAPSNTMVSRSTPGIVLGPTGNLQGTYKILNLSTGKKIKRRNFTVRPMPDSVIRQVEQLGNANARPNLFDFSDRNGVLFEWNEDPDEAPEGMVEDDIVLYPSLVAEFPGVALERDHPIPSVEDEIEPQGRAEDAAARNANQEPLIAAGVNAPNAIHAYDNEIDAPSDDDDDILSVATLANIPAGHLNNQPIVLNESSEEELSDNEDNNEDDADDEDHDDNDDDANFGDQDDEDEADEQEDQGVRRSKWNRRGTATTKYADYALMMNARHQARGQARARIADGMCLFSANDLSDAKPVPESDRLEWALGVALVHYSMNAGMKRFKEKGEAGVTKELKQMHDMEVFRPVERESLSKEERTKAVASLMFLKEKRDHSVKARMCADGRKQRGDWTKQETTSPTVSTEAVFITAVIEAHEGRDVACFDIPGAFLHADSDEDITMILKGRLAELMVQVAPNLYRKYISVDRKGTAILYVKMQKAIYGLLRSALLFYKKLVIDLEGNGFALNPYDPCVANKEVNGSQMTVCWHVDDLKTSHIDPKVNTKFGQWLSATYGVSVVTHRGKVHDYLGMIFDFSQKGKVMVNMIEYIKGIIDDFPEEVVADRTHPTSPAGNHLFNVRDESLSKPLPEEQARAFHHASAQLLFLSARARRDIQPATAFLTTRVRCPDEDDWGKVKRLLGYLKGTLNMPLVLSADNLTMSRWWVDAAYAVHDDCRGHTGAGMSLGQGMVMSYSWKQKINTKSSTEAELVGVDDSLGYILWARYFMQEQGFDMEASLIYQDNMSAMLLETNGKASSSKRTKHIKVKYFFIKDKVDQGDVTIEHCPTEQMWTDINTKPKQGQVFRVFRGHVMGIPADYKDSDYADKIPLSPAVSMLPLTKEQLASQECVGANQMLPTEDRPSVGSPTGNETPTTDGPSERAPIKIVDGRPWSPGVYRALRLLGKPLEIAWEKAFIRCSHF